METKQITRTHIGIIQIQCLNAIMLMVMNSQLTGCMLTMALRIVCMAEMRRKIMMILLILTEMEISLTIATKCLPVVMSMTTLEMQIKQTGITSTTDMKTVLVVKMKVTNTSLVCGMYSKGMEILTQIQNIQLIKVMTMVTMMIMANGGTIQGFRLSQ